jgi:hypothetical protein
MSGLINRMVQRARGTLPGAEPLVRSRHTAAAALGMPIEETSATAPQLFNSGPMTVQSPTPLSFSRPLPANEVSPLVSDFRQTVNEIRSHADNTTVPSSHEPTSNEGFHPNISPAQPTLPSPSGDPIVLEIHAATQALHEAIAEPVATAPPPQPSESQSASDRHAHKKTQIVPMKQEAGFARTRQPESATVSPLESATEHTEIHITIGSIELRTPRTETPMKAAPFKPRVTLDDYLRGRPGANS